MEPEDVREITYLLHSVNLNLRAIQVSLLAPETLKESIAEYNNDLLAGRERARNG